MSQIVLGMKAVRHENKIESFRKPPGGSPWEDSSHYEKPTLMNHATSKKQFPIGSALHESPLSPPSSPAQRLFYKPPVKNKFPAVIPFPLSLRPTFLMRRLSSSSRFTASNRFLLQPDWRGATTGLRVAWLALALLIASAPFLRAGAAELAYTPVEVPLPPVSKPLINDKGQVLTVITGTVCMYLPITDYGLPAGVHPKGAIAAGGVVIDFNSNGHFVTHKLESGVQSYGSLYKDGAVFTFPAQRVFALDQLGRVLFDFGSVREVDGSVRTVPGLFGSYNDINDAGIAVGQGSMIWDTKSGGAPQFLPSTGPNTYYNSAKLVNNKNQIFGHRDSGYIFYLGTNVILVSTGRLQYIYLPTPDHGLPAGFTDLPEVGYESGFGAWGNDSGSYNARLTDRGEIYIGNTAENTNSIWYRRQIIKPADYIFGTNTATVTRIFDINNHGAILATGSLNGQPNKLFILNPLHIASVEFTVIPKTNTPAPDVFFVGADFDVIATVRNLVNENILNVSPVSPPTNVVAGVTKALSNADPATPQTIPPNGTATFQWVLRAARPGEATIDTAFTGTYQGKAFQFRAIAPPILTVIPPVDLLLKRENEPTNAFAANNVYAPMLDGRQYRFIAHAMRDTNRFNVRIENDSSEPASFVLRAIAPSAENWQILYRHGATDITASVFSAGGWQTPELAAGAHTDVLLQLHDIAGDPGDRVRVRTEVSSVEDPEPIDAVIVAVAIAEVPVEIELQRVTASGYTATSIAAGKTDVDAPLELVTSKSVLETQPVIFGGWVADGVTPMLFKLSAKQKALEPFPEGRQFRLEVEVNEGGEIDGVELTDRLKLLKSGSWVADNEFELSPSAPAVFAMLSPVAADELLLSSRKDLVIGLNVVDIVSGEIVSEATLRLRKPPVVLIHGYNTPGDWGDAFILELSRSRPTSGDYPWVRVAKYGTDQTSGAYVSQMVNTLYTLDDLVPLAEQAYDDALAELRENWAFTRFDAVCHSQGGLLTRMLCSENTSRTLSRPFRNELNHNRGRFHRVVTLGSPHNGTRLLRYLIALDESKFSRLKNNLPTLIGKAGVFLEVAQAKFDPFGLQIRDLNNPSPASRWKPDPAAKFHLVRTTINRGLPPHAENLAPSYLALGLSHPVAGPAVLPRGSDGVVDFDSMGAHGPNQAIGANVFTLTPNLFVSHSPPLEVFGAGVGQTASPDVGAHVIAALDQNPNIPASERVFSSFVVPELLDDSVRQQIDHWADVSIFEFVDSAINPPPAPLGARSIVTTNLDFVLTTPTNRPVTGVVFWSVESFTPNGINSRDIKFTVNPTDSRRVIVHVPTDLIGDIVLYAHYVSTNGAVVLIKPRRIYSTAPPNAVLVGIEITPNNVPLPINSEMPIQIWTRYSSGHSILRYVEATEITAVSSAPTVVSTTNTIAWRMIGNGTATIVANYLGHSTTNSLTVYTPIPADAHTNSTSWQPNLIAQNSGFESQPVGTSVSMPPVVADGATFTGWRVFNVTTNSVAFSATIIANASAGGGAMRLAVTNTGGTANHALDQWSPEMHTPVQPGQRYIVSFDAAWIAGLNTGNLLFQVQEFDSAGSFLGNGLSTVRSVSTTSYQKHTFIYQPVNPATAGIGIFFGPLRGVVGATTISLDNVRMVVAPLLVNGDFESSPLATSAGGTGVVVNTTAFLGWRLFSVGSPPITSLTGTIVDAGGYPGGQPDSHALRLVVTNTGSPTAHDYGLDNNNARSPVVTGKKYTLSFDLALVQVGGSLTLNVSVAEFNAAGTFTGTQSGFAPTLPADQTFHRYTMTYVVANPAATQVVIAFRPVTTGHSTLVLDNVVFAPFVTDTPTSLSFHVNGATLGLTWPESHLGWRVQSNSVNVANPSAWFDIPGSEPVTNLNFPISPATPAVYYRLRRP